MEYTLANQKEIVVFETGENLALHLKTATEIVITDAATNLPIWVNSKNQGQWLEVIQEQMRFVKDE